MKKAKYIIVNSRDEYFKKLSKQNKAIFTKDKKEATEMNYSETEDLIPLIELYNGYVTMAEPVE